MPVGLVGHEPLACKALNLPQMKMTFGRIDRHPTPYKQSCRMADLPTRAFCTSTVGLIREALACLLADTGLGDASVSWIYTEHDHS